MKNVKFLKSVYSVKELPNKNLPEIILCGRSNVGKSSFINSLFNRKNLAKTSSAPGKTRSLNYYSIDDKYFIVDLPGFGYAKTSVQERKSWQKLVENFLSSSKNISLAFHFIDSRHEPTNLDVILNQFLREYNIPYNIILSKVDKLNQSELEKTKRKVREIFPELLLNENLFLYSSVKKIGKHNILRILSNLYN